MGGSKILCPASITLCFERCIAASIVLACVSTLMPATYCYGDIPCRDTVVHKHWWICLRLTRLLFEDTQRSHLAKKLWLITLQFVRFAIQHLFQNYKTPQNAKMQSLKWQEDKKYRNNMNHTFICLHLILFSFCYDINLTAVPCWGIIGDL